MLSPGDLAYVWFSAMSGKSLIPVYEHRHVPATHYVSVMTLGVVVCRNEDPRVRGCYLVVLPDKVGWIDEENLLMAQAAGDS